MSRRAPLTADEAARRLLPNDRLAMPLGPGQPLAFLAALGRRDDWQALTVFTALLTDLHPLFARPGVRLVSGFFGPAERALRAAGHAVEFVPGDFRRFEKIARHYAPRVVATAGAPPDAQGRVSLSLHAGATVDEIHAASRDPDRLLVVETSPHFPRTLGLPPEHPHSVDLEAIDVWIESDAKPRELPDAEPGPEELAIAEHVARFVAPDATLQVGIGGIPNAVVGQLARAPGGAYGIHSEMFTTGLMRLHRAGRVRNAKGQLDGHSIATFAMGSRALYDWLDGNPAVRFLPVDVVNDPAVIAKNRRMLSINGALAVDLAGQLVADTIDARQFSGIGGHEDFLAGTGLASDGRSLVCLPATFTAKGQRRSRIVARLPEGAIVTSPRHQADVVVTEYGAAELAGRTVGERARALAEIAHPDERPALRAAARALDRLGVDPAATDA
ncbi:MAG: acetyl-CoA hydrolase/transferase C-terminal domain-containing protein [Myxococcota bacterium]